MILDLRIADTPFQKIHDLSYLIDQCITFDTTFEQIRNISEILTPYATAFRYPGDVLEPNSSDAEEALKLAGVVLDFVRKKLPEEVKEK